MFSNTMWKVFEYIQTLITKNCFFGEFRAADIVDIQKKYLLEIWF